MARRLPTPQRTLARFAGWIDLVGGQSEAARRLGVTRSYVCLILHDKRGVQVGSPVSEAIRRETGIDPRDWNALTAVRGRKIRAVGAA